MRTVYLDQYTDENADAILQALDEAGIEHWEKRSGAFTRIVFAGDWGVRIFVDAERLEEARRLAETVTGSA
jgi:hypothetical protein